MANLMFFVHLGASVCVGLIEIRVWLQLLLGTLIVASFVWQVRGAFLWNGGDLKISDEGFCSINGDELLLAKIVRADVFAGFIRLRLAPDSGCSRTLILARDALTPGSYRELCARIRQGRLPVPDQAAMRDPL